MKSVIKYLTFDKDLVNRIKEVKTDKNLLYNYLVSGKITMQEYLAASQA